MLFWSYRPLPPPRPASCAGRGGAFLRSEPHRVEEPEQAPAAPRRRLRLPPEQLRHLALVLFPGHRDRLVRVAVSMVPVPLNPALVRLDQVDAAAPSLEEEVLREELRQGHAEGIGCDLRLARQEPPGLPGARVLAGRAVAALPRAALGLGAAPAVPLHGRRHRPAQRREARSGKAPVAVIGPLLALRHPGVPPV